MVSALYFYFIYYFQEVFSIAKSDHQINEEIQDAEVRLISENGEMLGIMSSEAALEIAEEHGYDLVKVAPDAKPPVCKIMDYGKFRYEQQKKVKENKQKQRVVEIKEIRMSPSIGDNDLNIKVRNALRFLDGGDRVKVSVRFRGREMAHTDLGEILLNTFADRCAEAATLDKAPKLEGRNMSIFLSPRPPAPAKSRASSAADAES